MHELNSFYKMKLLGIDFAPFNVPLHRRLETLGVGIACFLIIGLPPLSILFSLYILLFTNYWWIIVAYGIWIIIDKDTPENGGRAIGFVRSWILFQYAKNYFPLKVKVVPGFKLDRNTNYLGAWFPHGLLPIGVPLGLTSGYGKEFSKHSMYTITVSANFYIPIFREFILSLGMCSATPKSINHMLNSHGSTGTVLILPIGGSAESLNFKSEEYRIKLKNRKGFIKLALKNGVPVLPMFSFGENDLFSHHIFPEDSLIRKFQYWVRKTTNIAPLVFNGRGMFQYTFGIIPFRRPLNLVVGKPLDFGKVEDPTQAQIDEAHQIYTKALTDIFEEYKHYYEKRPNNCRLVIE